MLPHLKRKQKVFWKTGQEDSWIDKKIVVQINQARETGGKEIYYPCKIVAQQATSNTIITSSEDRQTARQRPYRKIQNHHLLTDRKETNEKDQQMRIHTADVTDVAWAYACENARIRGRQEVSYRWLQHLKGKAFGRKTSIQVAMQRILLFSKTFVSKEMGRQQMLTTKHPL